MTLKEGRKRSVDNELSVVTNIRSHPGNSLLTVIYSVKLNINIYILSMWNVWDYIKEIPRSSSKVLFLNANVFSRS